MYEMPIFCCNDRYGNTLVSRPVITKMSTQQKVADAEFMAATQPWQRAAVTMRSLGAIRRCDNTTIRLCKAFAQHATGNIQHAAHKMQHTACSTQNATYSMQHTKCNIPHAPCNIHSMSCAKCNMQRVLGNPTKHAAWSVKTDMPLSPPTCQVF